MVGLSLLLVPSLEEIEMQLKLMIIGSLISTFKSLTNMFIPESKRRKRQQHSAIGTETHRVGKLRILSVAAHLPQ